MSRAVRLARADHVRLRDALAPVGVIGAVDEELDDLAVAINGRNPGGVAGRVVGVVTLATVAACHRADRPRRRGLTFPETDRVLWMSLANSAAVVFGDGVVRWSIVGVENRGRSVITREQRQSGWRASRTALSEGFGEDGHGLGEFVVAGIDARNTVNGKPPFTHQLAKHGRSRTDQPRVEDSCGGRHGLGRVRLDSAELQKLDTATHRTGENLPGIHRQPAGGYRVSAILLVSVAF
jgi:hypothetical protein